MLKLLVLLGCAALLPLTAISQIPNSGFESWTSTTPDSWVTSNAAPFYTNVTQTTTAHTGSSAARGEVVQFYTVTIQPVLQVGLDGGGFAYTERPTSISGYYMFSPVGDDGFAVNVILMKGPLETGTAVANAAAFLTTAYSSYTKWTVPFVYHTSDTPDTCEIQFQIVSAAPTSSAVAHAGSYFYLDDIAFEGVTDVRTVEATPQQFLLHQNYPNPFNPTTTIWITIGGVVAPSGVEGPASSNVRLVVYDVLGREVATLANGQYPAGRYSFTFDARGLASGVYFYRLTAGAFVSTKRMMLVR